jgi:hypothetical protein
MHTMTHGLRRLACHAALLLAALAACAQVPPAPPAPPPGLSPERCTPGVCVIQVFVDNCSAQGGIRLDKPFVSTTSAVNMRWKISTPGFEFADNGIEFDPPNTQFERQPSPHRSEFRLQNHKTQSGDFYYFVNVKGCRRHDPLIRNE